MPGMTVQIVCLANSRKMQGRCLAGRKWNGSKAGIWIRPVSDRDHEEVSEWERQYEDGSDPRVLDVVEIPLLDTRPKNFQSENWLLNPKKYWAKIGRLAKKELPGFVATAGPLWINGFSSYHGLNDRIPLVMANQLKSSLCLIQAKVKFKVFAPGKDFGNSKLKVQATFEWGDNLYRLIVTDPAIEKEYLGKGDREHDLGIRFMTISLGEPYKDMVYKLVAAVI